MSAADALSHLRSGMRVFIGSGCAAPQVLVEALAARAPADYVVAEVNPNMPRTLGDSFVHVSALDAMVKSDRPILEAPMEPITAEAEKIAEFIESLVPDGATLQTGIGSIPSAVLARLGDKRDLGMHTEML